jgi:hypothetical protein
MISAPRPLPNPLAGLWANCDGTGPEGAETGSRGGCLIDMAAVLGRRHPELAEDLEEAARAYLGGSPDQIWALLRGKLGCQVADGEGPPPARPRGKKPGAQEAKFADRVASYGARGSPPPGLERKIREAQEADLDAAIAGLGGDRAGGEKHRAGLLAAVYGPDARYTGPAPPAVLADRVRAVARIPTLSEAVAKLESAADRSQARANFEGLGEALYGWTYPKAPAADLLASFERARERLAADRGAPRSELRCPNPNIALLWHLDALGRAPDPRMFDLPRTPECWTRNLADLGAAKGAARPAWVPAKGRGRTK